MDPRGDTELWARVLWLSRVNHAVWVSTWNSIIVSTTKKMTKVEGTRCTYWSINNCAVWNLCCRNSWYLVIHE